MEAEERQKIGFCPLVKDEDGMMSVYCEGDECAWWNKRCKACSVSVIASALDHSASAIE